MSKRILDGWKDIADYVGKSVRTIQRWEKEDGFPIRRVQSKRSVFAYADEIDKWMAQKGKSDKAETLQVIHEETGREETNVSINHKASKKTARKFFIAFFLLVIIIIVGYNFTSYKKIRTLKNRKLFFELEGEGAIVNIKDQNGKILKTFYSDSKKYKNLVYPLGNQKFIHFLDLNKDKILDMVYAEIDPDKKKEIKIFLTNSEGELVETKSLNMELEYNIKKGNFTYDNFHIVNVKIDDLNNDGKLELIVLQVDVPFYPSCLRILDLDGKEKFRFIHPGRFRSLEIRKVEGKKTIILSGTNNYLHKFSLPVIAFLKSDWNFKNTTLDFIQPENTNFDFEKRIDTVYLTFFIDNFKIKEYFLATFANSYKTKEYLSFFAYTSPKIKKSKEKIMGIEFTLNNYILNIVTTNEGRVVNKFFHPYYIFNEGIKNPTAYVDKHVKVLYYDGQQWRESYTKIRKPFSTFKKLPDAKNL